LAISRRRINELMLGIHRDQHDGPSLQQLITSLKPILTQTHHHLLTPSSTRLLAKRPAGRLFIRGYKKALTLRINVMLRQLTAI
jgi:hypothetical protein